LSEPQKVTYQKIGGALGIAAPLVGFTCILIAIASYPAFSWTNNALSDLGVIPGVTGPLFNFGLFASGLLTLNFAALGLFTYLKASWAGKIGSAFFAATAIALMAISVFNESFSGTHYAVSVAFFTLAPISLFIITAALWRINRKGLAVFTVFAGVAAALPWLLLFAFNYVPNVAIPEFLSGLAISAWTVMLSVKMLKP
jgi:hypothetical membrane protein